MASGGDLDVRPGSQLAPDRKPGPGPTKEQRCKYEREINMTAVDTTLQQREAAGNPIRVGMVGAGATGRAIALQLGTPVPGMRLVAISNRTPAHAERAMSEAGIREWARAESAREAEGKIARGIPVLTDDPSVLTECNAIDVLLEVTGTVEAAASVVLD